MEVTCDRISSTDGATSSKINTVGETEILGIATDTTSQNEDAVAGADVTSKKRESSVKSDDLPNKCSDKVVKRMASDYASLSRANLAVQHGDLVETVITLEEQLAAFSQMVQLVEKDSEVCASLLPEIAAQYKTLQPTFQQIDRLQELVERVQSDMDALDAQLTTAEESVAKSTLKGVLKSQLSLFSWQEKQATDNANESKYQPIEIFKTSDFFPSSPSS